MSDNNNKIYSFRICAWRVPIRIAVATVQPTTADTAPMDTNVPLFTMKSTQHTPNAPNMAA